jgi:hypothetical protein
MISPEHAGRSAALVAAARDRHDVTRRQAVDALRRLDAAGEEVNFSAVARAAGVSRAWLHHDPQPRAEIDRSRRLRRPCRSPLQRPVVEQASQESLRELRAALQAELNALREENSRLR